MYTFHIQPDFNKLRSCYPQYNDIQYQELVALYQLDGSYHTDEFKQADAESIEAAFKELADKYNIMEHYDNVFYLALSGYEAMQQRYEAIYRSWEESERTRQLARLLLIYKETPSNKEIHLSIKPSFSEPAQIKDQVLSKWIGKLVVESIEKKEFPLSVFGESVIDNLFGRNNPLTPESLDLERLKRAATIRIRKPTTAVNKLLAELCLSLYPYLQNYTHLKAEAGTIFSDAQLNFFYELLNVFSLLDNERIQSESKDYMSSLLRNRLNKTTDYQGNKTI